MSQVEGSGAAAPADAAAGGAEGASAPGATDNGQGAGAPGANADPLGDSLLTREDNGEDGKDTAGAGEDKAKGKDAGGEDADPMSLIPESPDGYDLKFAEGVSVDEALLNGFKAEAHNLGIPQGQAQKLADFYAKHAGESAKAAQEAHNAALVSAKKGWESEIMSRPEFKQEVVDARRTLKAFGGPELDPLLKQSMLGSHPAFFDFVVKVGKALAEPDARGSGYGSGKEKPLVDRLWPNMK